MKKFPRREYGEREGEIAISIYVMYKLKVYQHIT